MPDDAPGGRARHEQVVLRAVVADDQGQMAARRAGIVDPVVVHVLPDGAADARGGLHLRARFVPTAQAALGMTAAHAAPDMTAAPAAPDMMRAPAIPEETLSTDGAAASSAAMASRTAPAGDFDISAKRHAGSRPRPPRPALLQRARPRPARSQPE